MSGGYTPVFRSIFEGSLCGQWPYTAGWLIFLSLADQHGNVDMTPEYISAITGMPLDDLKKCISRFTEPDAASRSPDEEGRRLTLLDPARSWGWHVVNHTKYREKARLMAKNSREVSTGQNAERLKTAADRRSPPPTPSQTHTQTQTGERGTADAALPAKPPKKTSAKAKRCPKDFAVSQELREWAAKNHPRVNVDRETAKMRDHEFARGRSDWDAVWRTWITRAADFIGSSKAPSDPYANAI